MTAPIYATSWPEFKRKRVAELEREYFEALRDAAKGNISEMARRAGLERSHVRAYLRKVGLMTPTNEQMPQKHKRKPRT